MLPSETLLSIIITIEVIIVFLYELVRLMREESSPFEFRFLIFNEMFLIMAYFSIHEYLFNIILTIPVILLSCMCFLFCIAACFMSYPLVYGLYLKIMSDFKKGST